MKQGWESQPFEECIEKVRYTNKIQRTAFLDEGAYPVVSQEIELINGYWNEPSDVFTVVRPLTIFGDHTQTLKYIDFDFVLGADGVKILQPRVFLHPKFFHYQMQSFKFESLGYARHYRLLKEKQISYPSIREQERIVAVLDEAFEGIATAKAKAETNLQNTRSLFEAYLQTVFMRRGKRWEEKRLDEVAKFSSGGTPPKQNKSYWSGKVPWVSGRDMKATKLSDSLLHISQSAVDGSSTRMAPTGTLLILVRGMGLAHGAQVAELMAPCAFNQDIKGIHPEPCLIPRYLLFALRERINSNDTALSNAAHGTLKIDSAVLRGLTVPVPPREYQQRVVTTIDSLAEETQRLGSVYQHKLAALEVLKQTVLHQAFTGKL